MVEMKKTRYICSIWHQKKEIEELCFGKCGKVYFNCVTDNEFFYSVCGEKNCPYCEDFIEHFCEDDRFIYDLRKLKAEDDFELFTFT